MILPWSGLIALVKFLRAIIYLFKKAAITTKFSASGVTSSASSVFWSYNKYFVSTWHADVMRLYRLLFPTSFDSLFIVSHIAPQAS